MKTLSFFNHLPGLKDQNPAILFKGIPFLEDLTKNQWNILSQHLNLHEFKIEETIFEQGQYDSSLWQVIMGEACIKQKLISGEEKFCSRLLPGDYLGVSSCISGMPHSASAYASQESLLLEITFQGMQLLRRISPPFQKKMEQIYRERVLRLHLRTVFLFEMLHEAHIEELQQRVQLKTYRKGEMIVSQGRMADTFYLLRHGFVKIAREENGHQRILSYLKGGDFFGEMALIENRVRNASVQAVTDVDCVEISKEDFRNLFEKDSYFKNEILKAIEQRSRIEKWEVAESLILTGMYQAKKALTIKLGKCHFCGNCIKACAGLYGKPRIALHGTRIGSHLFPIACYNCDDPLCMLCPIGAIKRGKMGEVIILDHCNGCEYCVAACPFGAIKMSDQKAQKCDLCKDYPTQNCVYQCPTGAIQLTSPERLLL